MVTQEYINQLGIRKGDQLSIKAKLPDYGIITREGVYFDSVICEDDVSFLCTYIEGAYQSETGDTHCYQDQGYEQGNTIAKLPLEYILHAEKFTSKE